MRRSIVPVCAAIALIMSLVTSLAVEPMAVASTAAIQSSDLATADVAKQATDTVTLFLKRTGSTNAASRHRAWEMLTTEVQQRVFFGMEDAFYAVGAKILESGDVTVDSSTGNINVPLALKGFWGRHDFTHTTFTLNPDAELINGIVMTDDLTIPDRMTSIKLNIKVNDSSISTRRKPLVAHDIVIVSYANDGTSNHFVAMLRVPDGMSPESLSATVTDRNAISDPYTIMWTEPGKTLTFALMDLDAGTYILVGVPSGGPTETETLVGVFTTLIVVNS